MTDHMHKPTDTAEDLLWDDLEWEDDGEDGEWAGGECTEEELDELEAASAEYVMVELARVLYWFDPQGVKGSPHAEYLQRLLDTHGPGDPPDDLEPRASRVLH